MSKPTEKQWDNARTYFEAGKSLRDIEKLTNIPYKTVDYRAKKEAWNKGKIAQLITDKTRVDAEFRTLDVAQQTIVQKEVDKRMRHAEFFETATLKNISTMMNKIDETISIADHNQAQSALNRGRENVLGKAPDTAIQINNGGIDTASAPTDAREAAARYAELTFRGSISS